jgi:hypothetical protein
MKRSDFQALMQEQFDRLLEINSTKGHDYAGDDDALDNFKRDGERIRKIAANDPVYAKWYVYFEKHHGAVMTFLEEGDVKSEPIEGRIDDCLLYLFLLKGLIVERRQKADDVDLEASVQVIGTPRRPRRTAGTRT